MEKNSSLWGKVTKACLFTAATMLAKEYLDAPDNDSFIKSLFGND